MSLLRRAAATCTDTACRTVGRRHVVRAARFVLYRARLDIPNDLRTNGESSLQRWVLDLVPGGTRIHVIDVGANVGRWSASMLAAAGHAGRKDNLDLHAFEASAYTFGLLAKALGGQPARLHNVALSECAGSAVLHVVAPGAGINSLHQQAHPESGNITEEVVTTTLDSYAERARMDHVALLKIDTEGHDLAVLRGARCLLANRRISVAQFEYNHRWIYARSYLRDAFELLQPYGYHIGKLTPNGVEFYAAWDAELETFVEGNYVACLPGPAGELPSISWWKNTGRDGRYPSCM
jgi:FkbM family methyltransferase